MLARVTGDPNIDRQSSSPTMPFISFEMGNLSYASDRKLQSTTKTSYKKDADNFKYQYTPVPYDIKFKVYIFIKNTEDGTKIIEEILPYFTPEWTINVKLIPEMQEERKIPIVLNSVSFEDNYTGKFENNRVMIWTLDLTLQGFLYGPIGSAPIIKIANTNIYSSTTTANNTEINEFSSGISVKPGLIANGQPTSNSSISLPTNEIEATDDYGFIVENYK